MWAMQIIGMSAISLIDSDGNKVSIHYRLDLLLVSLFIITLLCKIGIAISTKDEVYTINKVETLEVYIRDSNNMTIGEMKKNKNRSSILLKTLFKGTGSLLKGSMGFGAALIIGNYLVITSLIIDECTIEWNIGPLIGIIFMTSTVSGIACWILFRLLALYPYLESLRLFCTLSIAFGICAIHYAFMAAAVTFVNFPGNYFLSPYPSFISVS